MNILNYIVLGMFGLGLILIFISEIATLMNQNRPTKKGKKNPSICILIPARDESKVISNILTSIKEQTYKINMKDVYVIVEKKEDKTVGICKKYGCSTVIREKLENRRRKGYALDDAVKHILKEKKYYDLYFVFDADNILDKDYIKEMLKTYQEGYDIGIGYRNCKNGNASLVAAASALVFSLINTFSNTLRQKQEKSLTITGTGFYIRGEYIKEWGEYPFHALTEDYELTLYSTLNNLTSYYNANAIYYDEQPIRYKDTIPQRTRWLKGYFESRRNYIPKIRKALTKKDPNYGSKLSACIGYIPYLFIVASFFCYLILQLFIIGTAIASNNDELFIKTSLSLLFILTFIYVATILLTISLLYREKETLNMKTSTKIKVCLYLPIFLTSYIQIAFRALFTKDVTWKKIEHTENNIT